MTALRRRPAVAGSFYPRDVAGLRTLVDECLAGVPREGRRCQAVIVPHAGLIYSGKCAGHVFGRIAFPATIVIVAPNHTGVALAPGASLWRSGVFETPLGDVTVDESFATMLERECDLVAHDPSAHRGEHAVEVELPFVRVLAPDAAIVPLVLACDGWDPCERLATALARAARPSADNVLFVASSDMTHYESAASAAAKDQFALAAVERLDGRALLETCRRHGISMCGRVGAAVVLEAARQLGATRAEVVDYRHSGFVTGDYSSVVGYAGVLIA